MQRISILKLIQSQGFGSRKECTALIRSGQIAVDGNRVEKPDEEVLVEVHELSVQGVPWPFYEQLYLALNKGPGFECSSKPSHHRSVHELFPEQFIRRGLQPAGRLDWDTRGLLILSDDGAFIHQLGSPKKNIQKRYLVQTDRILEEATLKALERGVLLKGETTPTKALAVKKTGPKELELSISEGKYHQVKRMIAAAGNHCTKLTRIAIGGLELKNLAIGENEWQYLDAKSIKLLSVSS